MSNPEFQWTVTCPFCRMHSRDDAYEPGAPEVSVMLTDTKEIAVCIAHSRGIRKATRGLPPISETSEEKPLFKSDDEMLISLTGSAKEVTLKNPDGSTWTPATPAPAGDETTPRTDGVDEQFRFQRLDIQKNKMRQNARTLERELAASRSEVDALRLCFAEASHNAGPAFVAHEELAQARREVADITKENERLTKYGAGLKRAVDGYHELWSQLKVDHATVTDQLHAANRANDSLRAQLTSIADEIEAINKSREEQAVNLAKVSRENEALKSQLATVIAERDEVAKQMAEDNMEFRRRVRKAQLLHVLGDQALFTAEADRDAAESRARTAEAACAAMREVLGRARGLLDNCMFIQRDINEALATSAGQPLLDELEKAKKDVARLDWMQDNPEHPLFPLFQNGKWGFPVLCRPESVLGAGVGFAEFDSLREAIDAAMKNTVANTPTA